MSYAGVTVVGNKAILADGTTVSFPDRIREAIDHHGIVVLVTFGGNITRNNVFGLDKSGRTLWRVNWDYPAEAYYYTGVMGSTGGHILVHESDGFTFTLDVRTGRRLGVEYTK